MAESPDETQTPIVIDVNDPDVEITPEILLEHNNPFRFGVDNAGGYDMEGVGVDPGSLRGLYRFNTIEDAIQLQLQVIERSGRDDINPAEFMQQRAEKNGTLTSDVTAAIIAVTNPSATPAQQQPAEPETPSAGDDAQLIQPDPNHPDSIAQGPSEESPISNFTFLETNKDITVDTSTVEGQYNEQVHVGLNEVGNAIAEELQGTIVGRLMGLDGTPTFYTVPENALEALWLGAHQPNITDDNAHEFFNWQLENMKAYIVFNSDEDKQAFITEAVNKRKEIGETSSWEIRSGEGEIRAFVSHMLNVSETLGVDFYDKDGALSNINNSDLLVVPHIKNMKEIHGPDEIKMEQSEAFVLNESDHDALSDGQFDQHDDEYELVEGYDKGLGELTPHSELALETFVNGIQDGTLSFLRLNEGQEHMEFGAELTWDALKAELGTDAPELRLMKDEVGDIYAVRLSNPNVDLHVYVDPVSFLTDTKAIFDAQQNLSQDQTLSTLKEVFNRAVQNVAEPKEELHRELSSGELAVQNTMAPPNAA